MLCVQEREEAEGKQQMGLLRDEHLTVCPPWTSVSLNFSGPVKVRGAVQQKITIKG